MAATMTDSFKGLGKVQMGMLAGVGVLFLGFFAIIAMRVSSPTFTTMYSNLSMEDSARIVSELEQQNVPYQIRANGAEIAVPSDRMLRLRMSMAEQGLPAIGSVIGYEIFDKTDALGSSQFVLNVNMLRALEGELARTIGAFRQVESARVHLVMPKRELFSRDKEEPTASVALKLRSSMQMEKAQVAAIINFVAAAVPGLKPSKVTIVDNFGRMLARTGEDGSFGTLANDATEYRVGFENRMRSNLEELIEKAVGPGRVQVKVTADINFDRTVTNKEIFDPEGQVVRSSQATSEKESSLDKAPNGAATVANQLPNSAGTAGQDVPSSQRENERSDETTNYEISKTVQNHVEEGGSVKKLSVAVLVDGNYPENADGDQEYTPRTEDELARITTLVKTAMGFNEARGDTVEVVNMRFVKPEEVEVQESFFDKFKDQFQGIIQTLLIAIVVILAILLVIRPTIMHLIRTSSQTSDRIAEGLSSLGDAAAGALGRLPAGAMAGAPGGADGFVPPAGSEMGEEEDAMVNIDNIQGRVRSSMIKKVADFVDRNPDESISVVRQWMAKEL